MNESPNQRDNAWKLAAFAGLAIAGVGAFATLLSLMATRGSLDVNQALEVAAEAFNQAEWQTAEAITSSLEISPDWDDDTRRLHAFLKSASSAEIALSKQDGRKQRTLLHAMLDDFDYAHELGFPEAYRHDGTLLLGMARYVTGDYTAAARAWEEASLRRVVDQRKYAILLAEAQLRSDKYHATTAEKTIDTFLALPSISDEERAKGQLMRARILADQSRWQQAFDAIATAIELPEVRNQAEVERARTVLLEQTAILNQLDPERTSRLPADIRNSIERTFEDLIEVARVADEITAMDAMYVAGKAESLLEEFDKAIGLLGAVRQNRVDAGVAIAAGFDELRLLAKRGKPQECIDTSTYLIRKIGDPSGLDSRWVSLTDVQDQLGEVIDILRDREEYEAGITIARDMEPLLTKATSLRTIGGIHATWAEKIRRLETQADGTINSVGIKKYRDHHARAGEAYQQAAEIRFAEADYPAILWQSIEQFHAAHHFAQNLDLLDLFLRYERRDQLPRGLIMQGKTLLSTGEYESAIRVFETCIVEYPRDSMKYEARILAADGAFQLGQMGSVRSYLEDNLHDGFLAPESQAWKDSLVALGQYLYAEATANHYALTTPRPNSSLPSVEDRADQFSANQQIFDDAINRLEEAVTRYDGAREIRRVKYLAAQAHQYAAEWPFLESQLPETIDSKRRKLNATYLDHLLSAANTFRNLRDDLNRNLDDTILTDHEQIMLRNCYLGEADALIRSKQFEEAIAVLNGTINRFINEPIALEALMQQTRCFESLGRDADVKRLLLQAQQILNRIPPESDELFAQTTRHDRQAWANLLEWLLRQT